MGYSNTKAQNKTSETENTFSGVNAQRKMAAVPIIQKVDIITQRKGGGVDENGPIPISEEDHKSWDKQWRKQQHEKRDEAFKRKEVRPPLSPKFEKIYEHITQGDLDSKKLPNGYHSEIAPSATHETYGKETKRGKGYLKSVRLKNNPSKKKPLQSSFFPLEVKEEHIRHMLQNIQAGCTPSLEIPTLDGISIDKVGNTVFPNLGGELPPAE